MTGPAGNSEFCLPSTSMFFRLRLRENIRARGYKTHCFPWGQSLSAYSFVYPFGIERCHCIFSQRTFREPQAHWNYKETTEITKILVFWEVKRHFHCIACLSKCRKWNWIFRYFWAFHLWRTKTRRKINIKQIYWLINILHTVVKFSQKDWNK